MKNIRGQVWIETVIYTLIALMIIGMVLAFVKPRIQEFQDKAVVEQSIIMMEGIDSVIATIDQGGVGNKRVIEMGIKKGILTIDGLTDQIRFKIEGRYLYSEPGRNIEVGNLIAYSEEIGKEKIVTLTLDYSDKYDIKIGATGEEVKDLSKIATLYKLSLANNGKGADQAINEGCTFREDCRGLQGHTLVGCTAPDCIYSPIKKTINIEVL